MRTVQLYVNEERMDLFADEQITVNSSVQNISDIGKIFNDFSQGFTVPATPRNSEILDYFYENSVDGDLIPNEKQPARIEVDHAVFRTGVIQLEGAEVRENQAYAYRLTFYGDMISLKDIIGDFKLSDLDYSGLTFEFTGANVQTAITTTSEVNVRFPLISSSRVWTYGDAAATDISVSGNAIDFTELFPAVQDKKILEAIATTYGLTFVGLFKTSETFKKSFTWWKNRNETNFTNRPQDVLFNVGGSTLPLADSIVYAQYTDPTASVPSGSTLYNNQTASAHRIEIYLVPDFTDSYVLDIYINGSLFLSPTLTATAGVGSTYVVQGALINFASLDARYSFKVRSFTSGTFTGTVKHEFKWHYLTGGGSIVTVINQTVANISTITLDNYLDWNSTAPDIRVYDWLSGLMKEFNLVCVPTSADDTYWLETTDGYYAAGQKTDITPYTKTESIKYDRVAPYKEIGFSWEKSKTFLNAQFSEIYKREYGDLKATFDYDGGKYEVKLPFENLLFNKFTGENLQVAYSLDKAPDYKPLIPKCVKLFMYNSLSCDFYLDTGTPQNITSYMPFGQDQKIGGVLYSQNFGAEQSSLIGVPVNNSLYRTHYEPRIQNIFSKKARKVTLECQMPLPMLLDLELNDLILLRDKGYRINDMKTNLTTGLVQLVLLPEFIPSRGRTTTGQIPVIPVSGGIIYIHVHPIKPTKGGYSVTSAPGSPFSTPSETMPHTSTEEETITLTIAANTGAQRSEIWTVTYYDTEGNVDEEVKILVVQEGDYDYRITEDGTRLITDKLDYRILE